MSVELMLLAVNINLVSFSTHLQDLTGQVFTLFVLTVRRLKRQLALQFWLCIIATAPPLPLNKSID